MTQPLGQLRDLPDFCLTYSNLKVLSSNVCLSSRHWSVFLLHLVNI
jgi:hypothetical protein